MKRIKSTPCFWILAAIGIALLLFSADVTVAAKPKGIIPFEDISVETMRKLFNSNDIKCTIDEDNDVRIEEDGIITYIRVDDEKETVTLFSIWHMKEDFTDDTKRELVNFLNDKLLMVRFCMPDSERLWCDYQIVHTNGVYADHLLATYDLFQRVCEGIATEEWDPDNILGRDYDEE